VQLLVRQILGIELGPGQANALAVITLAAAGLLGLLSTIRARRGQRSR
jgi:hypothetical protein